ncbi:MAG: GTP-binding protein [Bacillus subtilis]|nr:GTP-binding protein [Bacillus subtilis]
MIALGAATRRAGRIHAARLFERPHRFDASRKHHGFDQCENGDATRVGAQQFVGNGSRRSSKRCKPTCSTSSPRSKSTSTIPNTTTRRSLPTPSSSPKSTSFKPTFATQSKRSRSGRIIRDGIKTVIVGKPNVGKSSLLNSLLKEDKAIVTEISGTTRDLVEGELRLGGLLLKLIDTAGIRETTDLVEKIGIERTKKALLEADLVLLVLDSSKRLTPEDEMMLSLTEPKNRIIVGNKVDLGSQLNVTRRNPCSRLRQNRHRHRTFGTSRPGEIPRRRVSPYRTSVVWQRSPHRQT